MNQQADVFNLDWRAVVQGAVSGLIAGVLVYLITQKIKG